jgi:hypothetical protein
MLLLCVELMLMAKVSFAGPEDHKPEHLLSLLLLLPDVQN